ncbi:hypothetical protein ACFWF7_14815 [Nocardia sp. NPDC060256]|uniref:hypothetical protein n=1 Tax=unclassified Nocardia TaxID=2637762 RepID=UPI00365C8B25
MFRTITRVIRRWRPAAGVLTAACSLLLLVAVPATANPGPAGRYLHNDFYGNWGCLTDRGENFKVVLMACNFDADGSIAANQRWDHVPVPTSPGYFQLVSGLGNSLEFGNGVGGAYGTPLTAMHFPPGNFHTAWLSDGLRLRAASCVVVDSLVCTVDRTGTMIYLEPYQRSRPMLATIGPTTRLDNFDPRMLEWTQGP